jgi:hypothetical protein
MKTTFNKLRLKGACGQQVGCGLGYDKLSAYLGGADNYGKDKDISILTILKSNGLDDAIWCFRAVDGFDKEKRLFAVFCARQMQHLMKDARSINAINVAEKFANGLATKEELSEARIDAVVAAYAYAYAAAAAAASAAYAYATAAGASAAYAAAYYAADAADAADVAKKEIRRAQEVELIRILNNLESEK